MRVIENKNRNRNVIIVLTIENNVKYKLFIN